MEKGFNPFISAPKAKEQRSPFNHRGAKPKSRGTRRASPKRPRQWDDDDDGGSTMSYSGRSQSWGDFNGDWCELMTKQVLKLSQRERTLTAASMEGGLIAHDSNYVKAILDAKDNWIKRKEELGSQQEMVDQNGAIHISKWLGIVNRYKEDMDNSGDHEARARIEEYIDNTRQAPLDDTQNDIKHCQINGTKDIKVKRIEVKIYRSTTHYAMWKEIKVHLKEQERYRIHHSSAPRGGQERELETYVHKA